MFTKFRERILKTLHIPETECDEFFATAKTIEYLRPKDYFVKENETARKLAFVNKGALRMFYISPAGKEINTRFFLENDFAVAYQSFLLQQPGKYFIQALKDCELVTIPHSTLMNAHEHSDLWNKFGRIIAEKSFIAAERRNESLLFLNAEERYLELEQKNPRILEQVPLYHIASYIGIERESLSRLRKKISLPGKIVT